MTTRLESWYRTLIVAYPAGHRAVYAEDMINVLMDGALPGQQRPRLSTAVDLMKGATAAWALRLGAGGRAWQRAGTPTVIALLALLALCTQSITAAGRVLDNGSDSSYGHWGELALWLPDLIWLPIAAAAVVGLRRPAAWTAWGFGIYLPALGSVLAAIGWSPGYLGSVHSTPWFAVALIAAAGLSSETGVRLGFRLLGRTGSSAAIIGVLLIGLARVQLRTADRVEPLWRDRPGLALLATGLVLLSVACVRAVTQPGRTRTLTTVIAVAIQVIVSGAYASHDGGSWYSDMLEQVDITLPLTLLVGALIVGWTTAQAVNRQSQDQPDRDGVGSHWTKESMATPD